MNPRCPNPASYSFPWLLRQDTGHHLTLYSCLMTNIMNIMVWFVLSVFLGKYTSAFYIKKIIERSFDLTPITELVFGGTLISNHLWPEAHVLFLPHSIPHSLPRALWHRSSPFSSNWTLFIFYFFGMHIFILQLNLVTTFSPKVSYTFPSSCLCSCCFRFPKLPFIFSLPFETLIIL